MFLGWFLDFADRHWFLALAMILALKFPFLIMNRVLRSLNIALRGWPPPHVDADGDFIPKR